jgi:hypothetical protein
MSTARIESLTWVLIFGGMAVFGLGISVLQADDFLGTMLMVGGGAITAAGCVLVWVRSRITTPRE